MCFSVKLQIVHCFNLRWFQRQYYFCSRSLVFFQCFLLYEAIDK